MKHWVKPFLLERHERCLRSVDISEPDRNEVRKKKEEKLEYEGAVYFELTHHLNTHFGIDGIGGPKKDLFKKTFGSVLADLPKDVFLKLQDMRNLFFTFTPIPGAEVKHLLFDETVDIRNSDRVIVVTFPYESLFMPTRAARGMIAHELAHVYAHSDKGYSNDQIEDEADKTAIEWGLSEEIKALREYEEGILNGEFR